MGLLQPVTSEVLTKSVPAHLRDPTKHWFASSKRARVIMYNKEKVSAPTRPRTTRTWADPKWKGKLLIRASGHILHKPSLVARCWRPTDRRRPRRWAKGVAANLARRRAAATKPTDQGRRRGRGELCVSNTYYYT